MNYRNRVFLTAVLAALPLLVVAPAFAADEEFEKAEQALASKDYKTAIPILEKLVESDPDSSRNASEYRQAILRQSIAGHPKEGAVADFDKEISFFEKQAAAHPNSSNIYLHYGFAYVDKIAAAGSITQVILANTALTQFTKSLELKPTWIGLYTRGNSYLYWPRIFGRTSLGVADLERAYAMQKAEPKKSFHVRVYISLGDGYWKSDNIDKAVAIWREQI